MNRITKRNSKVYNHLDDFKNIFSSLKKNEDSQDILEE